MSCHPAKNGQYQPKTATSSKDCVAATTAMLVERATVGRYRPTHVDIRRASGAPATRGLLMVEAAKAANDLYDVTLTPSLGLSRATLRDTVGNGRAVGISISCAVTVNTSRRTNSYTGSHMVYANHYQVWPGGARCYCEKRATYKHGEFRIEDPGTTYAGYLWWSADLVYRAAEARTGGNGINILAAPDTEGVPWRCTAKTRVRTKRSFSTGATLTVLVPGSDKHIGGRTQNGGGWKRDDGTTANEWVHIKTSKGWGWVRGGALA